MHQGDVDPLVRQLGAEAQVYAEALVPMTSLSEVSIFAGMYTHVERHISTSKVGVKTGVGRGEFD